MHNYVITMLLKQAFYEQKGSNLLCPIKYVLEQCNSKNNSLNIYKYINKATFSWLQVMPESLSAIPLALRFTPKDSSCFTITF